MSSAQTSGQSPRREERLEGFEEAWQSGIPPRLEEFLPAGGDPELLAELVRIDLEYRWRNGERSLVEVYLARFPTLATGGRLAVELIGEEYYVRRRWGDRPSHAEYATRFPQQAAALPEVLSRLDAELAEDLGAMAAQARPQAVQAKPLSPAAALPPNATAPSVYKMTCPKCGALLRTSTLSAGGRSKCPRCATVLRMSPARRTPVTSAANAASSPALAPTQPVEAAGSVPALLDTLRACQIVTATQLNELRGSFTGAHTLIEELTQRGWLTSYQADQLKSGCGRDLVLDKYLLLDLLGEGGVGRVFKARHLQMQRVAALKVIRPALLRDSEVVGRFYREIELIAQMKDPHVVHAFDAGPVGATHMLVMEFVDGIDLGKLIKQEGRLPVAQACDYVRQAALGLENARRLGLVHRDIKPSNLLVNRKRAAGDGEPGGPWGLVKVLDLGLARMGRLTDDSSLQTLAAEGHSICTLTPSGGLVMLGTPDYMAPEQALDFHAADTRADIYSLGCTLHHLLTGQPPFGGSTLSQKLLQHQRAAPPPLGKLRPEVPPEVAALVGQMLAKDPVDRPQTPAEVAASLKRFSGISAAVFRPASDPTVLLDAGSLPGGRHGRTRFRRRGWQLVLGGLFVALAVFGLILALQTKPAPAPPGPAAPNSDALDLAWRQEVARMSAERQVQAVIEKLVERNPGLDRQKIQSKIVDRLVVRLEVDSYQLKDVSPVRALPYLTDLSLQCQPPGPSALADLTPLKGMALTSLNISNTLVQNLTPLAGMPLRDLKMNGVPVSDFTLLGSLPLESLECSACPNLRSLEVLRGQQLRSLHCADVPIESLEQLQGMRLTTLVVDHTRVKDLSPLKGMPLSTLCVTGTATGQTTQIKDLSPLKGMSLARLECSWNPITDLEPLRDMKTLQTLLVAVTRVKSLEPLTGLHVKILYCHRTEVKDLSPLKTMPLLHTLYCDFEPKRDAALLSSIKTLKYINSQSTAEFWQRNGSR
jgi:serine/threonine protein kinase/phage FluMu protein Com